MVPDTFFRPRFASPHWGKIKHPAMAGCFIVAPEIKKRFPNGTPLHSLSIDVPGRMG